MNNTTLHVVAGAGQIGPMVAQRLLARGLRVRLVRRGVVTAPPAGAEVVRADISNPAAAAEAMRGAAVVYHTANPQYHRWAQELLPLTRGVAAGAAAAGARLVALDNAYMYAVPADGRIAEDTRVAPHTKKGVLRAQAADILLAADRRGEVPVAILRASDFVGPGATHTLLGDRFWTRLLAGHAVEYLGDVDQPHSYSYAADVADAMVTLGTCGRAEVFGKVWHAPTLPAVSTRAWIERFARAAGVPVRTRQLTPWMLRLMGLFVREAAELPEMIYGWTGPYRFDDARFRAEFGAAPTPMDTVVAESIAWARAAYGRKGASAHGPRDATAAAVVVKAR